jgi:hypothetical protein
MVDGLVVSSGVEGERSGLRRDRAGRKRRHSPWDFVDPVPLRDRSRFRRDGHVPSTGHRSRFLPLGVGFADGAWAHSTSVKPNQPTMEAASLQLLA